MGNRSCAPNWRDNTGWGSENPPCTGWYGVGCDAAGQVITLTLPGNNLGGWVPRDLVYLDGLQALDLSDNDLRGVIPGELSGLSGLQQLYLDGNAGLMCWETTAAQEWAAGPALDYAGPNGACLVALLSLVAR